MILSLIFCLPKSLHAEATDAEQNRRTIAMGLAREGRCEVALPLLETAQSASPTDAEIAQLIGECAIRLQRFDLATKALDAARRLDPETPKVDLHLAIAHFHQGNPDRAAQALARAKATDGAQPEFLLYAGLVALSRADYAEAIQHFVPASKVRDRPV
ncbi:MAG: tetratricopeptide repeat protein, partial [Proteobacteria bacterium]|nr:tetratricopeptide repeat protein [Pseudomonadota bacterium]